MQTTTSDLPLGGTRTEATTAANHAVVPLSRNELLIGGIGNIIIMMIELISEIWFDLAVSFDHNNIKTESDLRGFGEYFVNTRLSDLIQAGVLIFVFPFFLLQYVAMIRTLKICFGEYHALRTVFSLSFIFYMIFLFIAIVVGVTSDAFDWNIYIDQTSNDISTAANMIHLLTLRLYIVSCTLCIYFASIAMISFWSTFVMALYFDSAFNGHLKVYVLPSCCKYNSIITKILVILLTVFSLIGAYLSTFSWSQHGFWSLNGGSQIFGIFTTFSSFLSALWLIWFALSKNYQHFNQTIEYQQFI